MRKKVVREYFHCSAAVAKGTGNPSLEQGKRRKASYMRAASRRRVRVRLAPGLVLPAHVLVRPRKRIGQGAAPASRERLQYAHRVIQRNYALRRARPPVVRFCSFAVSLVPPPSCCIAPFHGVHRVVWGSAGGSHPETGRGTEEARKVRGRLYVRVRPTPSHKMDRPIEAPPVWRSVVRKGVDVPPCIRRRRVLGKGNISGAPIREKFRDLHHSGSTDVGAEHVVRVERHEAVNLLALEDL